MGRADEAEATRRLLDGSPAAVLARLGVGGMIERAPRWRRRIAAWMRLRTIRAAAA